MTGQTPPGWYADPYGTPGLQSWWDGGQWTQATQPTDEWDDTPPAAPFGVPGQAQQAPGYGQQGWNWQPQQPVEQQQQWAPQQQPPSATKSGNKGLIWGLAG